MKHKQPVEKIVVLHDGFCPRELYPGTQRPNLERVLEKFTDRFELLDLCECGSPVWVAILPRQHVHELLQAVREREG